MLRLFHTTAAGLQSDVAYDGAFGVVYIETEEARLCTVNDRAYVCLTSKREEEKYGPI